LEREQQGRDALKAQALLDVGRLLRIVRRQVLNGDEECGYFLGEVLGVLLKNRNKLEESNPTFRQTAGKIGRAVLTTVRSGPLRPLIQEILFDAQQERHFLKLGAVLVKKALAVKQEIPVQFSDTDEKLKNMPAFSKANVDLWMDEVVFPRFEQMVADGKVSKKITDLAKARDPKGALRLSKLEDQIRDTVARIATVPSTYYISY
jgi:hypothetical protein